jgi:hypothetical protein
LSELTKPVSSRNTSYSVADIFFLYFLKLFTFLKGWNRSVLVTVVSFVLEFRFPIMTFRGEASGRRRSRLAVGDWNESVTIAYHLGFIFIY